MATIAFPATAEKSTRIKTEHARLGDPNRTMLEGVALPTAFQTVVDPTVVNMSMHQPTRPPPSANEGLDLYDVLNNPSSSRSAGQKATTSLPTTAQKSTRIKTEHAPLGDPGRTVLEGFGQSTALQTVINPTEVPGTQLKGMVSPSRAGNYPAHTPSIKPAAPSIKSTAPSWARSVLNKREDQKMASRQTAFASLTPAEKAKQNAWAQGVINRSIRCPQGFEWTRKDEHNGYLCAGESHFVTDDLIGEGKGGILLVPGGKMNHLEKWWGPYYPDPKKKQRFVYGGPQTGNHFSSLGPDWIEPKKSIYHWPKAWQIIGGLKGPVGNRADYPLLEQNLMQFWYSPIRIHREKSHGAILFLRKDKVKDSDPSRGSQSQVASPASPHRSHRDSHPRSPGSRHSAQPPYQRMMNVFGPPRSGFHYNNPFAAQYANAFFGLSGNAGPGLIPSAFPPNNNSGSQLRSEFPTIGNSHISRALHNWQNPASPSHRL
jgi:hypothetical protein